MAFIEELGLTVFAAIPATTDTELKSISALGELLQDGTHLVNVFYCCIFCLRSMYCSVVPDALVGINQLVGLEFCIEKAQQVLGVNQSDASLQHS